VDLLIPAYGFLPHSALRKNSRKTCATSFSAYRSSRPNWRIRGLAAASPEARGPVTGTGELAIKKESAFDTT
jgi:hypothetical protein